MERTRDARRNRAKNNNWSAYQHIFAIQRNIERLSINKYLLPHFSWNVWLNRSILKCGIWAQWTTRVQNAIRNFHVYTLPEHTPTHTRAFMYLYGYGSYDILIKIESVIRVSGSNREWTEFRRSINFMSVQTERMLFRNWKTRTKNSRAFCDSAVFRLCTGKEQTTRIGAVKRDSTHKKIPIGINIFICAKVGAWLKNIVIKRKMRPFHTIRSIFQAARKP